MNSILKSSLVILLTLSWSTSFGQEISTPVHKLTNENGEQVFTTSGYESSTAVTAKENEREIKTIEEYTLGELEDMIVQIDEKIGMLEFQEKFIEIPVYKSQRELIQNRISFIKTPSQK